MSAISIATRQIAGFLMLVIFGASLTANQSLAQSPSTQKTLAGQSVLKGGTFQVGGGTDVGQNTDALKVLKANPDKFLYFCNGKYLSLLAPENVADPCNPQGKQYKMWFNGFKEVLYFFATKSDGKLINRCSAVRVGKNAVLTARHCVDKNEAAAMYLLGMKDDPVLGKESECTTSTDTNCNADRVKVKGMHLLKMSSHSFDIKFSIDNATTTNQFSVDVPDLAILYVDGELPSTWAIASIDVAPPTVPEKLTQLGWGFTEDGNLPNRPLKLSGGPLVLVADQTKTPIVDKDARGWVPLLFRTTTSQSGQAGVKLCEIDSGGPVFLGHHNGTDLQDARKLIGVLSAGAKVSGPSDCKDSPWQAVQFMTSTIKIEICKVSNDHQMGIKGC